MGLYGVFSDVQWKDKRQWAEVAAMEIPMGLKENSSQRRVLKHGNRAQRGCGLSNLQDFQIFMGCNFEAVPALSRGWA